ncbi:hypothetical protein [Flavobacterium sp.]|jgi:hypothetical protein|uniref:hypothetical protein n=1 Tax=Flavobacterium sp. TaxID=239 RepID=UPI0037C0E5AA
MVQAQNQTVAPIARNEPIFRGLLYYISSDAAETETTGRQDKGFPEALKSRMDELDAQIAILERIIEQQKPKVGRTPGEWFDEARAYSVWLLAHSVWADQNGYVAMDFRTPKKVSNRKLIALAKQIDWDNVPVREGGASLFEANEKTLGESIARGRSRLKFGSGWRSEACEAIFRKLGEFNANDKSL